MSSYLVLARKYRPQDFSQLIGQDVLVKILTNAIKNDRLHHAFILTGIRGVGKTTTARIIAKTINCSDPKSQENAISCNECDSCISISQSRNQDVIEFDAASKTGVDDIRAIIDSIAYAPVSSKYKVYIIDEVHMLSNNAFNALLKTLEEPPPRVKFIFATTEIKKVPVTILSRCLRFDLRRLDESEIKQHLKNILQKEGFEFEDQALDIIAKMSEGSVRDSLSLTDQILAASNYQKTISSDELQQMLGLNDFNQVINLLDSLLKGQTRNSLDIFAQFYSISSDVGQLIKDLMRLVHDVVLTKIDNNYNLTGYTASQLEKIKEIAQNISLDSLNRIWQMMLKASQEIYFASSVKMSFEMIIVRICHLIALPNLQQILLNQDSKVNNVASKNNNDNQKPSDDLVNEILRNFEGSKLIF